MKESSPFKKEIGNWKLENYNMNREKPLTAQILIDTDLLFLSLLTLMFNHIE